MKKVRLINSKTTFITTIIIVPTLILIVFLSGFKEHRSLYLNSIISTTILSVVFVSFITTGLYNGWKLKDTVGKFKLSYKFSKPPDLSAFDGSGLDCPDLGDNSFGAVLVSIFLWIVIAMVGSVLLYYAGGLLWLTIMSIAAILYWIIFRAFRLVFRNSGKCRGQFITSLTIAIGYAILYNFWIFGIILLTRFLSEQKA